ncbi:MAG: hypothetical protein OEZ39_08370 [Gammaproteobacteria bacterium]|nr:hypothetical protein [Gammaproteobacteria bacterium]
MVLQPPKEMFANEAILIQSFDIGRDLQFAVYFRVRSERRAIQT